jgi:oligoendopeptidase F
MQQTINRNHMDSVFTFDLESLFENTLMCEQQMDVAIIQLSELKKLDTNPVSSAAALYMWLQHSAKVEITVDQVYLYAMLLQGVDRNNLEATRLMTRAWDLVQQCQKVCVPLNIAFATLTNQDFQVFCKEIPELLAWTYDYTRAFA